MGFAARIRKSAYYVVETTKSIGEEPVNRMISVRVLIDQARATSVLR